MPADGRWDLTQRLKGQTARAVLRSVYSHNATASHLT